MAFAGQLGFYIWGAGKSFGMACFKIVTARDNSAKMRDNSGTARDISNTIVGHDNSNTVTRTR